MPKTNNLYKFAWKVAKYFGTKPQFLYYDLKNDKPYYGDLKKDFIHYHLIFIAGIPLGTAWTLLQAKAHMIKDNIFWVKDKKEKSTSIFLINDHGEILDFKTNTLGCGYKYIKDWWKDWDDKTVTTM